MCGICGVIDFGGTGDASMIVRRMTPTMRHRGPDDEGFLIEERVALGMRRLSIIDVEGGHQPIFNEDGSIGVVLNGEIYNFREVAKTLEGLGHHFRTRSDSEVIAHAYEEWGADCVERLQGMFALAVYDARGAKRKEQSAKSEGEEAGVLFLARDRLGIKPLYYYAQSADTSVESPTSKVQSPPDAKGHSTLDIEHWTHFLFASEVRTLLASGLIARKLSRAALHSFLLFGSVSEPMTLVEGVLSLPPGHSLTIDLGSPAAAIQPQPYWNIAEASHANGHGPVDSKAATVHVRELLEESVRLHLIADVPVGVFLSGGIDSTSLAALASREVAGVHTFTVAFPEKEFSEAAIARRTAKQFHTTHDELMLNGDDLLGRLGDAIDALDQPSIDGINTYFVSWAARQAGLKVALSGLGGDEVFGGYKSTFRWTPRYQSVAALGDHVPGGVRTAMASALSGAGDAFAHGDGARKLAALWDDSHSLPHPYFFARALFTPAQVAKLLSGNKTQPQQTLWWNWLAAGAKDTRGLDSFASVTCLEARSYLVNTLLRDTDSMSMAHSLEVRVPFLHHPLVEYVAQLPAEMKIGTGTPKELLTAALADLLPAEVVQQTKRGFTFPWAEWLRGPLRAQMERGLSALSPSLEDVLEERSVYAIWEAYLNGKTSWSRPWSLYVLNEWVKRNLDCEGKAETPPPI
jgi:asparagine synthase (glutamine-hydrolysing)